MILNWEHVCISNTWTDEIVYDKYTTWCKVYSSYTSSHFWIQANVECNFLSRPHTEISIDKKLYNNYTAWCKIYSDTTSHFRIKANEKCNFLSKPHTEISTYEKRIIHTSHDVTLICTHLHTSEYRQYVECKIFSLNLTDVYTDISQENHKVKHVLE